jgi:hypothetical protein
MVCSILQSYSRTLIPWSLLRASREEKNRNYSRSNRGFFCSAGMTSNHVEAVTVRIFRRQSGRTGYTVRLAGRGRRPNRSSSPWPSSVRRVDLLALRRRSLEYRKGERRKRDACRSSLHVSGYLTRARVTEELTWSIGLSPL